MEPRLKQNRISIPFVWRKSVEKYKERLEGQIKSVLSDIEESILSNNQEVNQEKLPKIIDSEELKERLSAINKKLKEPSKKVATELQKLHEEHFPKLEK